MSQASESLPRRAAARFAVTFVVLLALFYAVYIVGSQTEGYRSYLALIAKVAGTVLQGLGVEATISGRLIEAKAFRFEIVPGCDGMEALALFGSAVLASPVALRPRLVFLVAGVVVLMVVNLLRIVTLFLVGLRFPASLEQMHWDLWPGILILLVLSCWLIWARWAWRRYGQRNDALG